MRMITMIRATLWSVVAQIRTANKTLFTRRLYTKEGVVAGRGWQRTCGLVQATWPRGACCQVLPASATRSIMFTGPHPDGENSTAWTSAGKCTQQAVSNPNVRLLECIEGNFPVNLPGAPLHEERLWAEVVQPGSGDTLQYLKGAFKKDGEWLLTQADNDGTRGMV